MGIKIKRSWAAFSLVEVMVSLGILGIVSLTVAKYFVDQGKSDSRADLINVRNQIYQRLISEINRINIKGSIEYQRLNGGGRLVSCFDDDTSCRVSTKAQSQEDFELCSMRDDDGCVVIAGKRGNPAYYDTDGNLVVTQVGSTYTPFKATAYFWATCGIDGGTDRPANSCPVPELLNFRVRVEPDDPPRIYQTADILLRPFPPDDMFDNPNNRHKMAVGVAMLGLKQQDEQDCPPGARASGFDSQGRVECQCIAGQEVENRDTEGRLASCNVSNCRARRPNLDPRLIKVHGFDQNGNPICKEIVETIKCDPPTMLTTEIDCGATGWVSNIRYGTCTPGSRAGKNNRIQSVVCDNLRLTCCKLQTEYRNI